MNDMNDEKFSRKQNCRTLLSFINDKSRCPVHIMMNTKERTKFTIFRNSQIFRSPLSFVIFSKEKKTKSKNIQKPAEFYHIFRRKKDQFHKFSEAL